jgi:hypothetical protein
LASLVIVVGAIGFAAGTVFSQEEGGKTPSREEMQKMMDEMSRPVEQHKTLTADAGTWTADVTAWMDPGKPPEKSQGTSTVRSICNGLYKLEEFKGQAMGRPFEGLSVVGYSKDKQKWFGFWCDSMKTTPEILWGTGDATGKVITFDGDPVTCPMGTYTPRWIVRHDDAGHITFEHWAKREGKADYEKGVEVKYTRK